MKRAILAVLLLAGCSHPAVRSRLDAACPLAERPHATGAERTAVRQQAKKVLATLPRAAVLTRRESAIAKALIEMTLASYALPSDTPSPLASALSPNGTPLGLAWFDTSLGHLAKACTS